MRTSRSLTILTMAACAFTAFTGPVPVRASLLGTNLIVNPGAEAGPASIDGDQVTPSVPGWMTNGEFNVVSYGTPGGFPLSTDPGPANRGTNFFCGGQNDPISTGTQIINVSSAAATIDSGKLFASLSGFLGGFSSQDDNATLTISFSNAVPAYLGSASIGPVLAADRGDATGLWFRQTNALVPPGTRTVLVTLQMTREEGSFNDGYADNLSLVLEPPFVLRASGSTGTVLWVTNTAVNHLQSTTNLTSTGSWTAWPGPVTFDGTNFSTPLGFTNAQRFFRLAPP